jgi:hypothetical protein
MMAKKLIQEAGMHSDMIVIIRNRFIPTEMSMPVIHKNIPTVYPTALACTSTFVD